MVEKFQYRNAVSIETNVHSLIGLCRSSIMLKADNTYKFETKKTKTKRINGFMKKCFAGRKVKYKRNSSVQREDGRTDFSPK